MDAAGEITLALEHLRQGDPDAQNLLIRLVYDQLRRIASRQLRSERPNHTLQSTALVHEAYLCLLSKSGCDWKDRAHFFGAAACAMRHILVDHARAARAQRRGGAAVPVELSDMLAGIESRVDEILAVDQALGRLREISPRQESIVEMRFYAGFTEEEIAEILQLSPRTVKREWAVARAWLHGEMRGTMAAEAEAGSQH
jgi:RNA polymerase sigma factor (TIGR02999 family)